MSGVPHQAERPMASKQACTSTYSMLSASEMFTRISWLLKRVFRIARYHRQAKPPQGRGGGPARTKSVTEAGLVTASLPVAGTGIE